MIKTELAIPTRLGNIKGTLHYSQRHQCNTSIICHGLLNNRFSPIIKDLEKTIFYYTNTFIVDFIGHGDSNGCTTFSDYDSQVEQLDLVIRYINGFALETTLGKVNLNVTILVGHSKGSNIILLYKSQPLNMDNINQIVCLCPRFDLSEISRHRFRNWKEQIERKQKFIWKWYPSSHGNKALYVEAFDINWRNNFKVEIYNSIKGLDIHLVHGVEDSVVSIENVDKFNLLLKKKNNVNIYKLDRCDHFFQDNQTEILNFCLNNTFKGITRLTDNKL